MRNIAPQILVFCVCFLSLETLGLTGFVSELEAQERPDRDFLFLEDVEREERKEARRRELRERERAAQTQRKTGQLPFDVNAENINFDSSGENLEASGNLQLKYSTFLLEADEGRFNIPSNKAKVRGDIRISDLGGELTASEAIIDMNSGAGTLKDAKAYFLDGDYKVEAEKVRRKEGDHFFFDEAVLTTCECPEGEDCNPWQISAGEAEVTIDGYGKVWDATLDVSGVPVLYLPYLIFPAKTTRQTGFLPFRFGVGDGEFALQAPLFITLGESADLTLTPHIETKTRQGIRSEFRAAISERHQLTAGVIYSDETLRDGDLDGTNVDDLFDPEFDENRIAAYIDHSASFTVGDQPFQYITDANFISDDLALRELEIDQIGDERSRFVTSQSIIRTPVLETYSAEVELEYNQAVVSDDDLVFQRLPEFSFSGFSSFKPFGENDLGLKLITRSDITATQFIRSTDFEGRRFNAFQEVEVPFYFQNILDFSVGADVHVSRYVLDRAPLEREEDDPLSGIADASSRVVPGYSAEVSTAIEKVSPVSDGSLLKKIAELGILGRDNQLVRTRHTIQPVVSYRYVPDVDQTDNPQFDSIDRLERNNLVSYELRQTWEGRFESRDNDLYRFGELRERVPDIEPLSLPGRLDPALNLGGNWRGGQGFGGDYVGPTGGEVVELASFTIGQSIELEELQEDGTIEDEFSDVYLDLRLAPNEYVRLRGQTNIDPEGGGVSSYSVLGQLVDKRGDELRAQIRFVDDSVRQLEAGLQLVVTDRFKVGYYGRYDDLEGEFLENRFGARLLSACNCWIFDIEAVDRVNPDRFGVAFTVTLIGIGEFGSDLFSLDRNRQS